MGKVITTDSQQKKEDPYGKRKIQFLEQVNEIELIVGIVGITVALVYQGIWVAIGITIGVIFLESVILVEINTAKNMVKLCKQNDRIESYLFDLQASMLQQTEGEATSPFFQVQEEDDEDEEEDPYKWYKIAGWSAFFIALTFLVDYFFS